MITIPLIKETIKASDEFNEAINQVDQVTKHNAKSLKMAQEIAAMHDHPLWQQFMNEQRKKVKK